MLIHPPSRMYRSPCEIQSTNSSCTVSGNEQIWLTIPSAQSRTKPLFTVLSGTHTRPALMMLATMDRRWILSARPGLYACTGRCARCKSCMRDIPALLSSTRIKSTSFLFLPSPYTVSYSSITLGRRSGYCRCSCQQSSTMTHMPPSVGLNAPIVMHPVGSLCVFSLVAQS